MKAIEEAAKVYDGIPNACVIGGYCTVLVQSALSDGLICVYGILRRYFHKLFNNSVEISAR